MKNDTELSEILEIVRSIQSAEDFKEKKDALMDNVEKLMNFNLDTLKKLQNSGLSKEELAPELAKFQQRWVAMSNEIEPEFNRLDTIPGIEQHAKALQDEFFKRMEPIAMEGEKIMMMLGIGGSSDVSRPSPSGAPPPGYQPPGYQPPGYQPPGYQPPTQRIIERQKLDELETLYKIKSIDELKNSIDLIINSLGDNLKDTLQKLQSFKNRPREEYLTEYEQYKAYMEVFDNEGKCEIERLQALPGGEEYIETFYKEMGSRLGSIVDEIDQLRKELR